MITKDRCTYAIEILRQDDSLREHGAGTPVPGVSGGFFGIEQACGRVDDQHAVAHVDVGDDRLHERHQDLAAARRPATGPTARTSWPWCKTSATTPTTVPSSPDRQADQVVVTELVGVVQGGQRARVDSSQVPRSPAAASLSLMPSNLTSSSPECQRMAGHGQRADLGGVGVKPRTNERT